MNWIKPHKSVSALFNGKSSSVNNEKTVNNLDPYSNNSTRNIAGNSYITVPDPEPCKEILAVGEEILEAVNSYNNIINPEASDFENIINPTENTGVSGIEAGTDDISNSLLENTEINITESNNIVIGGIEVENSQISNNQTDNDNVQPEKKPNPSQENNKPSAEILTGTNAEQGDNPEEDEASSSLIPFDDLVKFYVSSIKRKKKT